jgi:hypothetical protein
MMAEPTMPNRRSWVIGALVKPEASMLADLSICSTLPVLQILVFSFAMLEGQLEAPRLEMAKSASPGGREDAAVDPAEMMCLAAGYVTS